MRKVIAFAILISAFFLMLNTAALAAKIDETPEEATEQVLLRLLFHPAHDAIEEYYGEPRQYWRGSILSIKAVPDTPYYEVVMQVETFHGPHNPPYGIETMTFYVRYGNIELKKFEHQPE